MKPLVATELLKGISSRSSICQNKSHLALATLALSKKQFSVCGLNRNSIRDVLRCSHGVHLERFIMK